MYYVIGVHLLFKELKTIYMLFLTENVANKESLLYTCLKCFSPTFLRHFKLSPNMCIFYLKENQNSVLLFKADGRLNYLQNYCINFRTNSKVISVC